MPISIHSSCHESDPRIYEACSALAGQLRANYLPTLAEPLPAELKDLVAQLVEFEMRRQGSTRPVETLRIVMDQLIPHLRPSISPALGREDGGGLSIFSGKHRA